MHYELATAHNSYFRAENLPLVHIQWMLKQFQDAQLLLMEQNGKQFDVAVAKLKSSIYGQDGLISSPGETKNQLP